LYRLEDVYAARLLQLIMVNLMQISTAQIAASCGDTWVVELGVDSDQGSIYTVSQKRPTSLLSISSLNFNQFSKFFH